ncbi:putative kinase [Microbacterium sp. SORGH_AS 1204]|uniref:AAA family ATPase n=1 Tax=Microbacterium sp. SORGH_AS_1204 TaxID=3041785 RepID=UPI00278C9FE0|nr:AAA family ATPase [Microbacterium sp. SORGH_AS_1204]MDQ1135895.1 putative kinase [Microbacterium sp. SORGH_AS_1204]
MDVANSTRVIFVGGRSGVGKTTVAAVASRLLAERNVRHAVIEGDNLDHAHPEPWRAGIHLAEQNLAAIWRNYRRAGYDRLLFTNTVSVAQVDGLSRALGGNVEAKAVLLTADDATVGDRLRRREFGPAVEEHLSRSRRAADELDALDIAIRIATDGRTPTDIARQLLAAAEWLDG